MTGCVDVQTELEEYLLDCGINPYALPLHGACHHADDLPGECECGDDAPCTGPTEEDFTHVDNLSARMTASKGSRDTDSSLLTPKIPHNGTFIYSIFLAHDDESITPVDTSLLATIELYYATLFTDLLLIDGLGVETYSQANSTSMEIVIWMTPPTSATLNDTLYMNSFLSTLSATDLSLNTTDWQVSEASRDVERENLDLQSNSFYDQEKSILLKLWPVHILGGLVIGVLIGGGVANAHLNRSRARRRRKDQNIVLGTDL